MRRHLALAALATLLLATSAHAAITVTGFAFGSEDAVLSNATIEDFEDVTLVSGLTIRMAGTAIGTPKLWTGTLPRVWVPTTASGAGGLGGPFSNNTWDGTHSLTNGGWATGVLGGPGTGNFWDFQFADSVSFSFATPKALVGVGLCNFQSLGFPGAVTNHSLIINGHAWGLLESLPGWVGGISVRNRYLVVTASASDAITSIQIARATAADGLVFDKLATIDLVDAVRPSTWGRIKALAR